MLENTVTTFVLSKGGYKLSSRRVLFYLPERLFGYDVSSGNVIQSELSPVSVAVCPTPVCVRQCGFCSNSIRNKENRQRKLEIAPDKFVRLINDFVKLGVKGVSVAGGGEPLAYKGPIIKSLFLGKNLPFKIGVHTNGVLLEKILNEKIFKSNNIAYINISVIAHNPKLYVKICKASGNQFFRIERNILKMIKLKDCTASSILCGVKILICRENFSSAFEIFNYFKSLGVDNILIRCVGNFESGQDVELSFHQINHLIGVFKNNFGMDQDQITAVTGINHEVLPIPSRCWICALQYTAGVDPDGEVYLCSPWSRKEYSIGNINQSDFCEIWGSDKHKKVAVRLNKNLRSGKCNPLLCRHYYSNLAIDAFVSGLIQSLPKSEIEKGYGRFI
ncbi:MAG: radical SAM protein [Patescibacteria group bacterium]